MGQGDARRHESSPNGPRGEPPGALAMRGQERAVAPHAYAVPLPPCPAPTSKLMAWLGLVESASVGAWVTLLMTMVGFCILVPVAVARPGAVMMKGVPVGLPPLRRVAMKRMCVSALLWTHSNDTAAVAVGVPAGVTVSFQGVHMMRPVSPDVKLVGRTRYSVPAVPVMVSANWGGQRVRAQGEHAV